MTSLLKYFSSRFNTLKGKLYYTSLVFLTVSLLTASAATYIIYTKSMKDKLFESNMNYISAFGENVGGLLDDIVRLNNQCLQDADIVSLVRGLTNNGRDYRSESDLKLLGSEFQDIIEFKGAVTGSVITTNNFFYTVGDIPMLSYTEMIKQGYLEQLRSNPGKSIILNNMTISENSKPVQENNSIYIGGIVDDASEPMVILFKVDAEFLSKNKKVVIMDQSGSIIWTNMLSMDEKTIESLVHASQLKKTGILSFNNDLSSNSIAFMADSDNNRIYAGVQDETIYRTLCREALIIMILLLLPLLLAGGILSRFVCNQLIKPVMALSEKVRNIHSLEEADKGLQLRNIGPYWLGRLSFKKKLIFFYSTFIIIPSVLFISVFSLCIQVKVLDYVENLFTSNMESIKNNMELEMKNIEQSSAYISVNRYVQEIMRKDADRLTFSKEINNFLIEEEFLKLDIDNIDIFDAKWNKIYSTTPGKILISDAESNMINEFTESNNNKLWSRTVIDAQDHLLMPFIRKVRYWVKEESKYSVIGYVVVYIKESLIKQKYQTNRLGEGCTNIIIDSDRMVISSENKELIGYDYSKAEPGILKILENNKNGILISEGKSTLVFIDYLESNDWNLLSFVPKSNMTNAFSEAFLFSIVVFGIMIFIMIIIVDILANKTVQPVYSVKNGIMEVLMGNMDIKQSYSSKDELGALCSNIYEMISKSDMLLNEVYASKLRERDLDNLKKEAELISLQSQINPHFLYNTFTSVRFLIKLGETEKADQMIIALGVMFKKGVFRGRILVFVHEEIEHTKAYLAIQQMRFEDKMSVIWDIDESIMNNKVIKFILQPIVENAIYHGIELKDTPGLIIIRGKKENNRIILDIIDDGPGIPYDRINLLRGQVNGDEESEGIGLRNVNERIKIHCGDKYGLEVNSIPGEGVTVRIILPVIE